jgi:hypothetical protein
MAARVKVDAQSNTVKYRYQVRNWAYIPHIGGRI